MKNVISAFVVCAGLVWTSVAWPRPGDETQNSFVAAAKAGDVRTMEKLLNSPILMSNGTSVSATDFLSFIVTCKLTSNDVDMMTWRCPPAKAGGGNVLIVGKAISENGRIVLSKLLSMTAPVELPK